MTLFDILDQLGRLTLEPLWVPILVWTVLASVLAPALARLRQMAPFLRTRLHTALLLALPAGLIAAALARLPDVARHLPEAVVALPGSVASPAGGVPATSATVSLLFVLLGLLTAAAALGGIVLGTRLVGSLMQLEAQRRRLPVAPTAVQRQTARLALSLGVRRRVRVLVGSEGTPLTFGWRRPVIVVPRSHFDDSDLALILHHELIHVRHGDYVSHAVERAVCALFALHPLVHVLHRRAETYREMACDAALVVQEPQARARYARLLYRFATTHPTAPRAAVGIIRHVSLKQRLTAMKNDTRTTPLRPRLAIGMAAVLLFAGTILVACTDVSTDATQQQATAAPVTDVDEMPHLIPNNQAGMQALTEEIKYPEPAKEAGLEGRVLVQFVVSPDGAVDEVEVVEGLGGGLDAEAVRAVRTMRFQPGRQDGKPVPVQMTLPVTFRLDEDAS